MKNYCLDTNAIFDFCYRYYPKYLFLPIWEQLQSFVLSKQIRFIISEHIHTEIYFKATQLTYDTAVLDTFIQELNITIIHKTDYENELTNISTDLANITHLRATTINKNADDLSNICIAKQCQATVITAEQGNPTSNITDPTYTRLKIPDTCRHYRIPCENWLSIFEFITLTF